jgi:hypothetical protein
MKVGHSIPVIALLFHFLILPSEGKRIPAPKVEPVVLKGIRYVAPNDNGRTGYIEAWDATTNKKLWKTIVYRIHLDRFLEEDVQWVYITSLRIESGNLIVTNERDGRYSLNLKTRKVERLSPGKRAENR